MFLNEVKIPRNYQYPNVCVSKKKVNKNIMKEQKMSSIPINSHLSYVYET